MRRYAIIAITILLICITACFLVACEDEAEDYIKPIAWEKYVDEIIALMSKNYEIGDASLGFKTALTVDRAEGSGENKEKIEFELNLSLNPDNDTDRLKIRTIGGTQSGESETFLLYADNEKTYLHIYEWSYDKHSYYRYDNAPLFDVIRSALGETLNANVSASGILRLLADTVLTDANVNRDKSEYVFDFDFKNFFSSELAKNIERVLSLANGSTLESALGGLGGETSIAEIIKALSGKITIGVTDAKINGIALDITGGRNCRVNIGELVMSAAPLNYDEFMPDNANQYKNVKIGTVSVNGKIRALDKYKAITIVTYDFELNASLDLIQLIASDWDFAALDDENYFHFRLSHTCSTACTDYCSVELGNKLMRPNGSILDVAFAPKDFGTSNLYVSTSLKSFLNEKLINDTFGNASLTSLLLSDYQLFTISLPERRALREAESASGAIDVTEDALDVEKLIAVVNALHLDLWSMDISVSELRSALGDAADDGFLGKIISALSDYGIENISVDMGNPQYDSLRTYDIKDMALHIATLDIADGATGVKSYNNALLSANLRPSLSWSFNDGAFDGGVFVNNIYFSGSDASDKLYSTSVPISPEEIRNLKGGYLKYDYVDYLGGSGAANVGYARILDVVKVDYSRIGEYQDVTLKVGYPSMGVTGLSVASINDFFDSVLYTSVKIKVKLTELIDYRAERIDVDGSGSVIEEYDALEFYSNAYNKLTGVNVTYRYADGSAKSVIVNGKTDALISQGSSYIVSAIGEQGLIYTVCGKTYTEKIVFNPPDTIYLAVDNQPDGGVYRETYKIDETIKLGGILNKIKVVYSYGGVEKRFTLPVSAFKIDGTEITKGSYEWGVTNEYNGSDLSLIFYREGVFKISAEYMGRTAAFEIEVTSRQVGKSTYQILDKTLEKTYFSGPTYSFNTLITNKTHGSIGGSYRLELVVEKGRVNSGGSLTFSRDDGSWGLVSNKFGGGDIINGSTIDLPAMIIAPVKYDFSLYFIEAGYYRVKILIGGINYYEKTLEVKGAYGESDYYVSLSGFGSVKCVKGSVIDGQYKLSNKVHGSDGKTLPISVKVTDKNGNAVSEGVYEIVALTLNGETIQPLSVIELPPSIFNPYAIGLKLRINESGDYRVRIVIGDIVSSYISVSVE